MAAENGTTLPSDNSASYAEVASKGKGKAAAENVQDLAMDEDDDDDDEDEDEEVSGQIPSRMIRGTMYAGSELTSCAGARGRYAAAHLTYMPLPYAVLTNVTADNDDDEDDEDGLDEIDLNNIVDGGRRTRGRVIDFAKAAEENPADDDDDEDEEDDYQPPDEDVKMGED